jgi:hypothetical protein
MTTVLYFHSCYFTLNASQNRILRTKKLQQRNLGCGETDLSQLSRRLTENVGVSVEHRLPLALTRVELQAKLSVGVNSCNLTNQIQQPSNLSWIR